jgi:hypothetical protein
VNGQALDSFGSESDFSESGQGACYRRGRCTHFVKEQRAGLGASAGLGAVVI